MFNNYFKTSSIAFFSALLFMILSMCIYTPVLSANSSIQLVAGDVNYSKHLGEFTWPLPNSSTITSYFGLRKSPTKGASTYHNGIDISATEGSDIIAVLSGTVIYAGFYGGNGCTIMIQSSNFIISYCHVSPNYIVHVGEEILKGQVIANVGPKYLYGIINNKYIDETGNPTNGATTGTHLHLSIKRDGIAVNPLDYLSCLPSSL